MAALQRELPASVGLVSFTVDPDYDNPERLKAYAARFGAKPGRWFFATGPKARLYSLLTNGFKLPVAENPGAPAGQRVIHSTKFTLVDSRGFVVGYYDSDDVGDLRRLKRDALSL